MDVAASERVSKLLDIATGTTGLLVDPASLRDLKRLAKASDSDLRQIHALLQEKLAKRHAQVSKNGRVEGGRLRTVDS